MKLCLLSFTVEVWKTLMVFSENSEVVTGFGDIIVVESGCLRRMAESLKKRCLVSVISNGNINPFQEKSLGKHGIYVKQKYFPKDFLSVQ